jgi:hypothetical protein
MPLSAFASIIISIILYDAHYFNENMINFQDYNLKKAAYFKGLESGVLSHLLQSK